MKKLVSSPFNVLWQAIVLPVKLLFSSLGFTFRAGIAVGKLPVKGGAVVSKALGWKILGAVTVGVVIGFFIGRQIGRMSQNDDRAHEPFDAREDETESLDAGVMA